MKGAIHRMDITRILKKPMALCIFCGLSACGTFVTYTGTELPDEEVATFRCYSRYYFVYMESCSFQAIDGLRPGVSVMFGNTSKILPGSHWIEIAFEKYFGGGGGVTDVCAFDMDLEPNTGYQVLAHSLTTEISHLAKHQHRDFYGGAMDIEITKPSGAREIRRVHATCSPFGGSMCRKDDDCVHHPDIRCFPRDGFPFGQCGFKDAGQ